MLYFLLNEILEHECNFPCVQICHHKPALRVWAGAHGPDLLSDAVWPQRGPVPSEPVPLLPFLPFIQQEELICSLHPRHEPAEPQQQSTWSPWQTEVSWPSFLSLTSTEWVCVRAFVHFCGFSTLCTERMLCVCACLYSAFHVLFVSLLHYVHVALALTTHTTLTIWSMPHRQCTVTRTMPAYHCCICTNTINLWTRGLHQCRFVKAQD